MSDRVTLSRPLLPAAEIDVIYDAVEECRSFGGDVGVAQGFTALNEVAPFISVRELAQSARGAASMIPPDRTGQAKHGERQGCWLWHRFNV